VQDRITNMQVAGNTASQDNKNLAMRKKLKLKIDECLKHV
jgi:hypothetical protein